MTATTSRRPERMTALDASFLYAETERTPLHLGSVSVFEGAPFFDDHGEFQIDAVRARVAERLHLFPRFRRKVAFVPFDIGRPFWVDDDEFDIAKHVKVLVLPPQGSREELAALAIQLHMKLLHRDRPLWELWFVGGLDDGNIALVEKIHHAMVDGVSGVDVAAALLDLERSPEPIEVPRWHPAPPPAPLDLVVEGVLEDLSQPLDVARNLATTVLSPRDAAARLGGAAALVRTAVRSVPGLGHSSLRAKVGRARVLRSVAVDLDAVKEAGHTADATVNDVVLTAVAAGAGDLLRQRGLPTDDAVINVMVPVSVRDDHEHLALGNRVSIILAELPLRARASGERLLVVRDEMRRVKEREEAKGTEVVLQGIDAVPAGLLALASRSIHHQPFTDMVVTNVPGPPCPLYFLGAQLLESIPIVPLGGNLTIGIAILSYNGTLTFGVHADAGTCPDLAVLIEGIEHELTALGARPFAPHAAATKRSPKAKQRATPAKAAKKTAKTATKTAKTATKPAKSAAGGSRPATTGQRRLVHDEVTFAPTPHVAVAAHLQVPPDPRGVVVFAHGAGSDRHSPRNQFVADVLHESGFATVLVDLVLPAEDRADPDPVDVALEGNRLIGVAEWLRTHPATNGLDVAYIGTDTGAAAALWAAAELGSEVTCVIARDGRLDLVRPRLGAVRAPTLLVANEQDADAVARTEQDRGALGGPSRLVVVPGAGPLFDEPGALPAFAEAARDWLLAELQPASTER